MHCIFCNGVLKKILLLREKISIFLDRKNNNYLIFKIPFFRYQYRQKILNLIHQKLIFHRKSIRNRQNLHNMLIFGDKIYRKMTIS